MRQIAIRERAQRSLFPTAESAVSPRGACRRFQLASRGRRYTVLSRAVGATRSGHNTARTHAYTPSLVIVATRRPSLPGMVLKNSGLSCSRNASGIPSIQAAPPVLAHVQTIITTAHRRSGNRARKPRPRPRGAPSASDGESVGEKTTHQRPSTRRDDPAARCRRRSPRARAGRRSRRCAVRYSIAILSVCARTCFCCD